MRVPRKMKAILQNKKVILRCDFNVPLEQAKIASPSFLSSKMKILDDFRIRQALPTIQYLIKKNARIILMSHLAGNFSLKPIAERLGRLLQRKVKFLDDCVGEKVKKSIENMNAREIVLLENLRLHKGEEKNDANFALDLAKLGDVYINDAFGVCHRAHASVVGIPKYLPSAPGFLLKKEIKALTSLLKFYKKPLIAIVGGKKVETKAKLINKISEIADFVLIGDMIAKELKDKKIKLKYPFKIVSPCDKSGRARDISPETVNLFKNKIRSAKTIFWTGPLGMVEKKEYQRGSLQIARAIAKKRIFSVVGGGETIWFLGKNKLISKFSHASTGGGAMLAFLSGEKMPGLEALKILKPVC